MAAHAYHPSTLEMDKRTDWLDYTVSLGYAMRPTGVGGRSSDLGVRGKRERWEADNSE